MTDECIVPKRQNSKLFLTARADSGRLGIWRSLISNAASAQIPFHHAIQNLAKEVDILADSPLWSILQLI